MPLPARRVGRLLIAVATGTVVLTGTILSTAPSYAPDQSELALAPLPGPTAVAAAQKPAARAETRSDPAPSPTATSAPVTGTQFERMLRPFLLEARRRRQAQQTADPSYWSRVDPRLNSARVNFLLFGYGETHEPPLTERAFIGSLTVFSYDYHTRSIDLVSVTHDIRAPEIERFLQASGQAQVGPIKIDRAYSMGGFDLMRRTVEDATGLAIDFALAFKESAIAGATDSVFGGLDVDVPLAFDVNPFYLDGHKFPGGSFARGHQKLDGMQVIQFIKTVPVEAHYDPALEHNARKHLVFRAIMDSIAAHATDVGFLGRAALFFTGEVADKSIAYDFDLRSLLIDNLRGLMGDIGRTSTSADTMPAVARTLYIVDPASGDGGVQWVQANARTNVATRRDLAENVYGELAMELPYSGDARAPDLVGGYWPDVRKVVATRLAD